jgi:uncharacterized protein (TIGR02001 family)
MRYEQSAFRALGMAGALAASAILGAAQAAEPDPVGTNGGPQFSANATVTSDYRFRGFTQTRERSALQGGVDVTWRQFYTGVWASNIDLGSVNNGGRWHDVADIEVISYAGVRQKFGGFGVDLRALYYAFPGAYGLPQDLDYFEVMAGVSREIHNSLTADFKVYYSPDYQGEVGRNWVFEGGLTRKLGTFGSLAPALSARLGYSAGDESKGGFDYWYWNAGFSVIFHDYFEFDLRYYDTFDVPTAIAGSCRDSCDGRVVARITFEN